MLKGEDWFNYVHQNDQDIKKYNLVSGGNVQSKVFEQKKKILLNKEAREGDSPESYKIVSHELGHAKNNSINPHLYKKYQLFQGLWVGMSVFILGIVLWQSIAALSGLLPELQLYSLPYFCLLFLFTIINYLFAKVKYNDESYADNEGKKLINSHLQSAMAECNDTRNLTLLQKRIVKVFEDDYVSFWKAGYTFFIFSVWGAITLVFLLLPIILK